jgi:hypothetical protein
VVAGAAFADLPFAVGKFRACRAGPAGKAGACHRGRQTGRRTDTETNPPRKRAAPAAGKNGTGIQLLDVPGWAGLCHDGREVEVHGAGHEFGRHAMVWGSDPRGEPARLWPNSKQACVPSAPTQRQRTRTSLVSPAGLCEPGPQVLNRDDVVDSAPSCDLSRPTLIDLDHLSPTRVRFVASSNVAWPPATCEPCRLCAYITARALTAARAPAKRPASKLSNGPRGAMRARARARGRGRLDEPRTARRLPSHPTRSWFCGCKKASTDKSPTLHAACRRRR